MSDFLLVVEYRDSHDQPIKSVTNVDINLINMATEGGFLTLELLDFVSAKSRSKKTIQKIILPHNKVDKVELVDLTSPKCPPEYIEMAVREELKNGKS